MTNGDDFPHGAAGSYRLRVYGGWGLLELSDFGRQYVQVYSLIHALEAEAEDGGASENLLQWALRAHPWRGGWSAVNFFKSLIAAVPGNYAPRIAKIEYASPGSIELLLAVGAAQRTRLIVNAVCSNSLERVNATYDRLHKEAKGQQLLTKNAKHEEAFKPRESAFAARAADELIHLMGMEGYVHQLKRLARNNPISLMKVIFALYRRVRVLAELQDEGKIRF